MCKYCDFDEVNDLEKSVGGTLLEIKDGSETIEIYFNRTVYNNRSEENDTYLALIKMFTLPNGQVYEVNSKYMDIKYCPFCGEKL